MTFDPSTDFEDIVDGLQAVTLEVRGGSSVSIAHAHRNQHRRLEADPANGKSLAALTTWQWPMTESSRPPLGSVIVDATGDRYTVVAISEQVLGSKYSADCRRLSVEFGLDTYVDLLKASYAKNAQGEAIATWTAIATGLRARVQPSEEVAEIKHRADEVSPRFAVILERDLPAAHIPVGANLRVRDRDRNVYRILRHQRPERIDALPVLLCERV